MLPQGPHPRCFAIVPARLGSTRFPRKILADATGKPLLQHVCDQAARAASIQGVFVATDAPEVRLAVEKWGGVAVMTGDHPNGASRIEEAARRLNLDPEDIVINVQGDEPEVDPSAIDDAVAALHRSRADAATIAAPFAPDEDPADPNAVKVVLAGDGAALYFSRSLIPFHRTGGVPVTPLRHVGLYVYKVRTLRRYVELPPSPLEQCEMLEQLRLLEAGLKIAVALRPSSAGGIDTPAQYEAFVKRWQAANPR